jgi:hypothetical protein
LEEAERLCDRVAILKTTLVALNVIKVPLAAALAAVMGSPARRLTNPITRCWDQLHYGYAGTDDERGTRPMLDKKRLTLMSGTPRSSVWMRWLRRPVGRSRRRRSSGRARRARSPADVFQQSVRAAGRVGADQDQDQDQDAVPMGIGDLSWGIVPRR